MLLGYLSISYTWDISVDNILAIIAFAYCNITNISYFYKIVIIFVVVLCKSVK